MALPIASLDPHIHQAPTLPLHSFSSSQTKPLFGVGGGLHLQEAEPGPHCL